MSPGLSPQQNLSSSVKLLHGFGGLKRQDDSSGRVVKSILMNKQNQFEQQNQPPNMERRPPPGSSQLSNGFPDDNNDRRSARNKDRPDRGVWTPLKRSDESLSSTSNQGPLVFVEGTHGEGKNDMSIARSGDFKPIRSGRGGPFSVDNGSQKHGGRRGPSHKVKDADGSPNLNEGKPLKRGVSSSYNSHEKQVWVQKSSSGS